MTMGAAANALLDCNLTQSQVFAAPPYNFSPANFALLVGAILGILIAGPFSDWVAIRATVKNGGIREPEMRLPALIPFIIAAVVGMTVSFLSLFLGGGLFCRICSDVFRLGGWRWLPKSMAMASNYRARIHSSRHDLCCNPDYLHYGMLPAFIQANSRLVVA